MRAIHGRTGARKPHRTHGFTRAPGRVGGCPQPGTLLVHVHTPTLTSSSSSSSGSSSSLSSCGGTGRL